MQATHRFTALAEEIAAEVKGLAAVAARSLAAAGDGLEPAELAIRTATPKLRGRLSEGDQPRRGQHRNVSAAECGHRIA